MKRILVFLIASCVIVSGCKKSTDDASPTTTKTTTPAPVTPPPTITAVPSTFTQKAVIEEFTGAWCGYCPDGAERADKIMTANPGKVYNIAIHNGDPMAFTDGNSIETFFNQSGFPSGMVNRMISSSSVLNRGYWSSITSTALAQTAPCGLAIDASTVSGNTVTVKVHCGFKQTLTGEYRVIVALIENGVTGNSSYSQHNYMGIGCGSTSSTSQWYNSPCVISGYSHKNVLRKYASNLWGDVIPSTSIAAGKEYVKTYTVDITGYAKANCQIVAYVDLYGSSYTTHKIQNVQMVNVGAVKNWN